MSLISSIKDKYIEYKINNINKLEMSVNGKEGSLKATPKSPEKSMPKLKITLKTLPNTISVSKNREHAVRSLENNPDSPKTMAEDASIQKFEEYARSIGIDNIGYTKVLPEYIFKDRTILFGNAIVLTMEMDKEFIDMAPSPQTHEIGIITYDELGKKTNMLAEFLRENGFGAHASHPAGGIVLYPYLAQSAGLGYKGRHGMIITPEFGPRQRISAIFTSIQNLPINDGNKHSWIPDFCANCGNCIKKCPGNAIREEKSPENGEIKTKIIYDLCQSCTICMMECSFNKREYVHIKDKLKNIQTQAY